MHKYFFMATLFVILFISNCAVTTPAVGINLNYNGEHFSLVGKSTYSTLFGVFSWGDGSIISAMNQAGIKRIHHIDIETKNYLIYKTVTFIVYGDDPVPFNPSVSRVETNKSRPSDIDSSLKIVNTNGNYGLVNPLTNHFVIPPIYEGLKEFSEGLAAAKRFGKWGYINEQGNMVIDFKFDKAGCFSNGTADATYQGKNGYIDDNGNFYEK